MKKLFVYVVLHLAMFLLESTSASNQLHEQTNYVPDEDDIVVNPTRQSLGILSSHKMIMKQNELLEERLRTLEDGRNTTSTNTSDADSSLLKKLEAVSTQVQSNTKQLEKIAAQQEEIIYQLTEDKKLNSSLFRQIRGFLVVDRFNSDRKWTVLKKVLLGILDHSDVAYQQIQELSGDDPSLPMADITRYGYLQLLQTLLDYGLYVDIEDPSTNNDTFLHLSAFFNQLDMAQLLLERGANVSARNEYKATPLILAATIGNLQVLRLLVKSRADINAADKYGRTALHYSAEEGYLETVRYLVESRANTKVEDNCYLTPLDLAIKENQEKVVKFLSQFSSFSHLKS